jgi:hypothetical protein
MTSTVQATYWTADPWLRSIGDMRILITGDRQWRCADLAVRIG